MGKSERKNFLAQMKPDEEDRNWDPAIIDSYLPSVPKVTTDQPLRPQDAIDKYELKQEYKRIYEGKFNFDDVDKENSDKEGDRDL